MTARKPKETAAIEGSSHEGRVPPQAVDVEKAVLGAMLLEKEAIAKAVTVLDDAAFYKNAHQSIFKAILALFERGEPVDLITLIDELRRRGELEKIGGEHYLTELTTKVTSAANVEYHAHIVLEKAIARQLIASSFAVIGRAFTETEDIDELVGDAQKSIIEISGEFLRSSNPKPIVKILHPLVESLEDGLPPHGTRSYFYDLNNLIGGYQPGGLYVIAGRPSQGKTSFALQDALFIAEKEPVVFFSLEMSEQQLAMKALTLYSGVETWKMRDKKVNKYDVAEIARAAPKVGALKLHILDKAALSAAKIRAYTYNQIMERGVKGVFVDYLQLMTHDGKAATRDEAIGKTSSALKALAKDLNIFVVMLSQLNRAAVPENGLRRPQLHHLRESGNIENDVDVAILVHRPEQYLQQMGKSFVDDSGKDWGGVAEILVQKDRLTGRPGDFEVRFDKKTAKFDNLAPPGVKEIHDPLEMLLGQKKEPQPSKPIDDELPF